ncbi:LysM peptidoglycan-binding domain-containing C40 family peptidase [Streptomyces yanii]|uniref:LysM peptidoglycan-binding domain-containing C40 family peptidase n=1 Tax=Streptomyces yanii TaxID=78510 RepID=A0ABV5R857_9ACTN
MSPQTLLKPVTGKKQTPKRTHRQAPAPAAPRKPAPRHAVKQPARRGTRLWTVMGLTLLFVLSLLAGVLLAVHGPSQPSSGTSHSVTLQPDAPVTPKTTTPDPTTPKSPQKKEPKPAAKRSTITLKPGDTLYALARTHHTTVKTLQRLNGLGSSTLIYAGYGLRVPAAAASSAAAFSVSGGSRSVPAPSAKLATKPTKPAKGSKNSAAKPAPDVVVAFAQAQLGKPYRWGGTGPISFDCSGLVMRAWEKAGVKLPRTTWGQIKAGRATTRSALVPGDLVITSGGGHVQLYIGNGKVIHAPRPGTTITVSPLYQSGVVSYRHITA